jgi:hypothetical protein
MKAIVVTDEAAGTAGMTLVERPEPDAAGNDVVVEVHASGFTPAELVAHPGARPHRHRQSTASLIAGLHRVRNRLVIECGELGRAAQRARQIKHLQNPITPCAVFKRSLQAAWTIKALDGRGRTGRNSARIRCPPWGDPVAVNGDFRWPPTGRFPRPPSAIARSLASSRRNLASCAGPTPRRSSPTCGVTSSGRRMVVRPRSSLPPRGHRSELAAVDSGGPQTSRRPGSLRPHACRAGERRQYSVICQLVPERGKLACARAIDSVRADVAHAAGGLVAGPGADGFVDNSATDGPVS